jgi:tetratricopeptide (TPR) repeat protein
MGHAQSLEGTGTRPARQVPADDATAHDNLGVRLAESGKTEQAVLEFEKAVELSEDFALGHFHLALAYDRLGQASRAAREYEAALRLQPELVDARYGLSAICWKLGDREGAIQLLRQITPRDRAFAAEVHYNLGVELRQVGRLEEATQQLQAALQLQPQSVPSRLALAQVYTERQDFTAAAGILRDAVKLAPGRAECHYDLGEALRLRGELGAAEDEFRAALRIDPRYPHAHRQLGLVLRQKGNYGAAAAELRQAVAQDAQDAESHYYLGSALLKLGERDMAIDELTLAARLDPYDSGIHVTLAQALRQAGKGEEAAGQTKQAQALDNLKANAGRSRVLLGAAVEHLGRGEVDTAIRELRESTALSPDYPEAQYQLARAMLRKHAPDREVANILRRTIELKPDYARAHLELGPVLQRMDQTGEGLQELQRAAELAPSLVEARRALGRNALRTGDWPAAVREFGAILVFNPDDQDARKNLSLALARRLGKFIPASGAPHSRKRAIDQPNAFFQGEELVGAQLLQPRHRAARPADFELVHLRSIAQAEMQARVLSRLVAHATFTLVIEGQVAGDNLHSGSDPVAI